MCMYRGYGGGGNLTQLSPLLCLFFSDHFASLAMPTSKVNKMCTVYVDTYVYTHTCIIIIHVFQDH